MLNITTTDVPKILPKVKTESIYLIFDSNTWGKKLIQLNILFLLGIFSYIFCICYVIIIKKSNSHIYNYKPELVYEIRTEPTDEETYNSIFLPEARLKYYNRVHKISKSSSKEINKENLAITQNNSSKYKLKRIKRDTSLLYETPDED